jgi:hypothetical protein
MEQSRARAPDEIVNAITEDRSGRIWYTGDDSLVCLDGSRWRRYFAHGEVKVKGTRTRALTAAANGRIIFQSKRRSLEALDPDSGRIDRIVHPKSREVVAVDRTPGGNLGVLTIDPPGSTIFNAASESTNSKIQSVKYTGHGFRSTKNFVTALYSAYGSY